MAGEATTLGSAAIPIRADLGDLDKDIDKAEQKIEGGLGKAFGKLSGALGKIGKAAVVGGIGLAVGAVVGLGAAAYKAGMEIDGAYDGIIVKTGATGKELEQLKTDFGEVFRNVPSDAETVSGVVGTLNQTLGITGDQLTNVATPLLDVSRLLGGDATANTQLFTQALQNWNVPIAEAPGVLDMFYKATQETGIGLDQLMGTVSQFGPQLKTMGFDLTESTALLGALEKSGIPASNAMMGLQFAAKAFVEQGVPLKEGLLGVIEKIEGATSAEDALAIGMETFGSRAALPMVQAIRDGTFSLEELIPALQNSEGAISSASQATEDWPEKWEKLKNKATLALQPMGAGLMDVASNLLDKLMPAFESGIKLLEEKVVPAFDKVLQAVGFILKGDLTGALFTLFGSETTGKINDVLGKFEAVWAFVKDNFQPIIIGLGAVAVVAFGIWAASAISAAAATILAMLPVILVVAAIGLAVGFLVKAWEEDWGGIREKTAAVWEWLKGTFEKIKEWFTVKLPEGLKALKEKALEAWEKIEEVYDRVWTRGLKPGLDALWDKMKEIAGWLSGAFTAAWDGIKNAIGWVIDKINDVKNAFENIKNKLPSWLVPGSPTPFEEGLRGIARALPAVNRGIGGMERASASLAATLERGLMVALPDMGQGGEREQRVYHINMPVSYPRYQSEATLRDYLTAVRMATA